MNDFTSLKISLLWQIYIQLCFWVVSKLISGVPDTIPTSISASVRVRSLDHKCLSVLQLSRLLD